MLCCTLFLMFLPFNVGLQLKFKPSNFIMILKLLQKMPRQEKKMIPHPQPNHNKLQNVLHNSVLIKNKDFTFEQEKPFSGLNFSVQHAQNEGFQQQNTPSIQQYGLITQANYQKNMQILKNAQPSKISENKALYKFQAEQNKNLNYFNPSFLQMFMMQNLYIPNGCMDKFNEHYNIFFSKFPILRQQTVNKTPNHSIKTIEIVGNKKNKQINQQIGDNIVRVICLDEEESQDKNKKQETQKTDEPRNAKALFIQPRQDDPFLIIKTKKPKKYDYSKIYGMSRYKYMKMLREKDEERKRQEKRALPSISEERSLKEFYQLKIQRSKKIKKEEKKKKQVDKNEWVPKYPIKISLRNQQVQESQSQLMYANIPNLIKQDAFLRKSRKIQEKKMSLLSREFFQRKVKSENFQEQI